jgi:hypothetical protein
MCLRLRLGIEDQLRQPLPIPHVEKHQVPMIAIRLHPATQDDLLAGVVPPKLTTSMRSLQHNEVSQQF